MPKYKLKSHSGAKKRFHFSGSGKILRTKGMKSHLRRRKADRVKRQFDEMIATSPASQKLLRRMLPYGA